MLGESLGMLYINFVSVMRKLSSFLMSRIERGGIKGIFNVWMNECVEDANNNSKAVLCF